MKDFTVGYIALSKASWVTDDINTLRNNCLNGLKELPYNFIYEDSLTTTADEAKALCSKFNKNEVDAVILHFATFPVGAIIPVIARSLNVPVILYSTPEEPLDNGVWAQNSFCGANMAAHTMRKLGKKYSFVFGPVEEAAGLMQKELNVLKCVKTLADAKIGLVGGRVPGFYTSNCDEMLLRKYFGTEVEILDQLEVVDTAGKLSDADINAGVEAVKASTPCICSEVEGDVKPAAGLYQSFKKTVEKYSLSAFAVRCWPEWSDIYGIAPCSVMGMLNNDGISTSCEGDVLGAVLMMAQNSLADSEAFFSDLISFDNDEQTAIFWHCGAAPVSLCRKFEDSKVRRHFRVDGGEKKGLVNEFPLKAGAVTVAQLDEDEGGYRLLIAKGEALDTEQIMRGNPLNVKFDFPVEKLVNTIMKEGFKHHYTLIHSDISEELISLCELLDIKPVIVE